MTIDEAQNLCNRVLDCIYINKDGHWDWVGYTNKYGRGLFYYQGKSHYASRIILFVFTDFELDNSLLALHTRECVGHYDCANPKHLYVGTQTQNNADRVSLITHCPKGHEYNKQNTYWRLDRPNTRQCKVCSSICKRRNRLNRKQERPN